MNIIIWNYTEEESQDCNDEICKFMGGVIEPAFGGGDQYRFDPIGTPSISMKCPPFGVLPRSNNQGQKGMMFHYNYQHLTAAIRACYDALQQDNRLQQAYNKIKETAFDFSVAFGNNNDQIALLTHRAVVEFIRYKLSLTPDV